MSAACSQSSVAAAQAEIEIEALLSLYFDGLYFADPERLRRALHPQAIYASATEGSLNHLAVEPYLTIVAARVAPADRGEPRRDEIVSIERVGPVTAVARVRCAIGPKHFDDILSLILVDGRWQIIAKVFDFHLEHEPRED